MDKELQRAITLIELTPSPYFSIINVHLVDINVFAKSDEIPSLPVQVIKEPEDHWSRIAHLSAEDMLKSAVIEEKKFKYSPWAGADNPLGPKFLCQQEGLISMVIYCKFKNESLQPLTSYTSFHDLINVYSHRSGADNPRGQNIDVNRNVLSLRAFATSFKTISLKSDFI